MKIFMIYQYPVGLGLFLNNIFHYETNFLVDKYTYICTYLFVELVLKGNEFLFDDTT